LLAPTPEEPDVFWKRKRDTPVVSPQVVTVEDLRVRAGKALVTADDAVRAASEELSYAQAQFGLSATDPFTAALETARGHLARSFELRKLLDDDIPETEPVQRQMYSEILQRCNDAVGIIKEQESAFNARRGLEANLPTSVAETAQRADETEQAIAMANTLLVTLHATYPAGSLTSVSEAPERAGRLLEAGRTALDQARASIEAGQHPVAGGEALGSQTISVGSQDGVAHARGSGAEVTGGGDIGQDQQRAGDHDRMRGETVEEPGMIDQAGGGERGGQVQGQAAIGESRTMREGAHVGECIERH